MKSRRDDCRNRFSKNPAFTAVSSPSPAGVQEQVLVGFLFADGERVKLFEFLRVSCGRQESDGITNDFLQTLSATGIANVNNRVSTYDPGVGLRYQF